MKWITEKRKINDLIPYAANPRQMTDKQNKDLTKSLEKFDLVEIPAINTDGTILAGHQRLRIMQTLGRGNEEIDVRVPDRLLTEKEVQEYNIRSNKNTGEFDFDILANSFDTSDLLDWGFDEKDLKIDTDIEEDDFDTTPPIDPVTKIGDLYQLGNHRLLCGDAKEQNSVDILFAGEQPRLVVTSPPYADARTYNIGSFDWDELMRDVANTFHKFTKFDALINLGQLHRDGEVWFYWHDWIDHMRKCGYPLFGLYIWDKVGAVPGDYKGRLATRHEWIFHFRNGDLGSANKSVVANGTKGVSKTFRQKDGSLKAAKSPEKAGQPYRISDSIIVQASERNNKSGHPAVYPVRFVSELVMAYSTMGNVIYDPFGGSGSTLIACEQLGRTCYMMEIDPKYCDVIVKRWETLTGKKAELING